ncbi:MAG TPA: MFS transporter, partial [Candidatus Limnocylindria bacterium]|nr:MFS transporter [Candidatus Limnocylindria bacterium]
MAHFDVPADEVVTGDLSDAGSVFSNRAFLSLWSAQVLSQLASNIVLAALMAAVFGSTGSNTANAVLILTFLVPAVLFSVVAGVFIERADARIIMLATNIVRAVGTVGFIFVAPNTQTANVPLVYALNLLIATASAFFAPAELTAIPRLVDRRHLMAANSIFVLTVNATFALGFGFLGPLLLKTTGPIAVYVVVAVMFAASAVAIIPISSVPPDLARARGHEAQRAVQELVSQVREGMAFVRRHKAIAWSLTYLGVAASLIGVMGAIGPGFAEQILHLTEEDFFFVMGPAGIGAVIGILFLNSYGRELPKRLVIDIGLLAMGVTLIALAVVKPLTGVVAPAVAPIEERLPTALAPLLSLIAVVVVIAVLAGVEYAFVAIPSQTALQEDLPSDVRGRVFGILNTLLSIASFFPVIAAPAAADLLNIAFEGAGIPIVMALLGMATLWAGVASWRRNQRAGLHRAARHEAAEPAAALAVRPPIPDPAAARAIRRRRRRRPADRRLA